MILKTTSRSQEAALSAIEPDGISVFTLSNGTIRGACASATRMAAQMRTNHGLGILETIALGQAAICAGLLSTTIKGEDALSLRIDCEGPLRGLSVEARAGGQVRGRIFTEGLQVDQAPESLDLAPWIGRGSLSLTRISGSGGAPFTGQVALQHSRIAEDLAEYYLKSEQTPTAFAASLKLTKEGELAGAGGLYLQALPGADEEALSFIERVLAGSPSPGSWIAEGRSRRDLLIRDFLFADIDFLAEGPLSFFCPCERGRFLSFLRAMPEGELSAAIAASPLPGKLELLCHNCGTAYVFDSSELE